jgi:arylsulfatase A
VRNRRGVMVVIKDRHRQRDGNVAENPQLREVPVGAIAIPRRTPDRLLFETRRAPHACALPDLRLRAKPFRIHIPLFVPEDAYDPDPANACQCVIEHIDAEVGRLVNTVRAPGLAKEVILLAAHSEAITLQEPSWRQGR